MMTLAEFWPQCLSLLQAELPEQSFQSIIAPLTVGQEQGIWVVYAKNQFIANLVRSKYADKIAEASLLIMGQAPVILYKVGVGKHYQVADLDSSSDSGVEELVTVATNNELKSKKDTAQDIIAKRLHNLNPIQKEADALSRSVASEQEIDSVATQAVDKTNLSPDYTFETLVIGKGNELAASVAQAVAEKPGIYNPFLVYGSTGLGKTHLAQAIGHKLLSLSTKARVLYIHSDDYLRSLMKTVRDHTWDVFKQRYLHYDLLIIDDIQFIAGKERTMEEFFFLFEHLHANKQQIVLTCDQLPSSLEKMDQRLVSRFAWGMTLLIEPPELEMRMDILERKAQKEGFTLDNEATLLIAQNVKKSVRDLEGALNRLLARCRFEGLKNVTEEMVKNTLNDIIVSNYKLINVDLIMKTVADYYHISIRDILGKKRTRNIVRPRQIAMTLTKELTNLSLPAIGDAFGGRDHSTVIHAVETITKLCEQDPEFQHDYNKLLILIQH